MPAIAPSPAVSESELTRAESHRLEELEGTIDRGLKTFREVGLALLEIRDTRLYRVTDTTFNSYCMRRWGFTQGRAYQLIGAAQVAEELPQIGNEAQAAALATVYHGDPKALKRVWSRVERKKAPITAKLIREAVAEVIKPKKNGDSADGNGNGVQHAEPVTPTAKLLNGITRMRDQVLDWKGTKPNIGERGKVRRALEDLLASAQSGYVKPEEPSE